MPVPEGDTNGSAVRGVHVAMKNRFNDRVEGRDAALSRRVPSHDGLCGNGSEVGAGDTAKG